MSTIGIFCLLMSLRVLLVLAQLVEGLPCTLVIPSSAEACPFQPDQKQQPGKHECCMLRGVTDPKEGLCAQGICLHLFSKQGQSSDPVQ